MLRYINDPKNLKLVMLLLRVCFSCHFLMCEETNWLSNYGCRIRAKISSLRHFMFSRFVQTFQWGCHWWYTIPNAVCLFQVFVANPTKADPILKMLYRNKRKLLEYLQDFHNDRGLFFPTQLVCEFLSQFTIIYSEDEEFQEEKELLVREISTLDADD